MKKIALLFFLFPFFLNAETVTTNSGTTYIDTAISYVAGGDTYNGFAEPIVFTEDGGLVDVSICINNTGDNLEDFVAQVVLDNSGAPTGATIATSNEIMASNGVAYNVFTFAEEEVTATTDYWVIIRNATTPSALYRPCGLDTGTENQNKINGVWAHRTAGQLGLTIETSEITPIIPSGVSTTSEITLLGSINMGLAIIITLLSLGFVSLIFGTISKRKPWH